MTTLTIAIVVVFVIGYAFIALESFTRVNKAAVALLMFVGQLGHSLCLTPEVISPISLPIW